MPSAVARRDTFAAWQIAVTTTLVPRLCFERRRLELHSWVMQFMVPQILAAAVLLFAADPFAAKRDSMVREQIEARGVHDADVLRVMRDTPRDRFVSASWRKRAYDDTPLPIGFGVTISQPFVVGMMTQLLAAGRRDSVLEIGTGSGYQAAVLAQLAGHVYTIEIVPALARSAAALLAELGYGNVTVRQGDGYLGWPERAPFDRIILTAAPEQVPQALVDQLACGGRLVAPVGRAMQKQDLVAIEKTAGCVIRARTVTTVYFVPMVHGRGEKP
jgi:protein-L-isoaspartate(D-aspartate) O-methyltransferase